MAYSADESAELGPLFLMFMWVSLDCLSLSISPVLVKGEHHAVPSCSVSFRELQQLIRELGIGEVWALQQMVVAVPFLE